ncbi:MAG: NADH-quinone oxidoreductase subunit L [Lachnospiraceae bacterium]|nr:NADH-quinone oxidoreductase subunit L [Lachnospiraceae bacterium]
MMILDVAFCAWAFGAAGNGDGYLTYFPPETAAVNAFNHVIIAGEIFLFLLITVLSIKHGKWYCILLSFIGTAPVLWMDFTGRSVENAPMLKIDSLTVLMFLVVGLVGGLICIYSNGYLHDYHHHHTDVEKRPWFFQSMLFLFLTAMYGLISSDNMSWMFFFWEITSTISFLLIGYTRKEEAVTNSFRALWMNLLGGFGFTVAILYSAFVYQNGSLMELISMSEAKAGIVIPVACLSFAAFTKSAQMPFSRWLLGAMVAPTPSSALLHSATMVKAGVYLLIRISPLMTGNLAGVMVTTIGGFTFFAASLLAISQSDGKKVLAYSTISNLGLITACSGVGEPAATWAAIMLLLFHAVSKSLMFLCVGAVENATGSRDIEDMHGLIVKMPKMAFVMTVAICGMFLAPFGMLVAKWAALKAYIDSNNVLLVIFLVFGSATTMFYWGKWLGKLFAVLHQSETLRDIIHKSEWYVMYMLTALVITLCATFPFLGQIFIQPMLSVEFGVQVGQIISSDDVRVMLMMLIMIALMPVLGLFLLLNRKEKMTMSYMAGANAGDDRHFVDAFGGIRPSYLSNWYMDKMFGEKRILIPSLCVAAAFVVVLMILTIGGAI